MRRQTSQGSTAAVKKKRAHWIDRMASFLFPLLSFFAASLGAYF
jgi:hypothetical protein